MEINYKVKLAAEEGYKPSSNSRINITRRKFRLLANFAPLSQRWKHYRSSDHEFGHGQDNSEQFAGEDQQRSDKVSGGRGIEGIQWMPNTSVSKGCIV